MALVGRKGVTSDVMALPTSMMSRKFVLPDAVDSLKKANERASR